MALWIEAGEHQVTGNLTRTIGRPSVRTATAPRRDGARLVLNARVQMPHAELENVVRDALATTQASQVKARIEGMRCLQPGRPWPTHQYVNVVAID